MAGATYELARTTTDTNALARREWERRPQLSLVADEEKIQTRPEAGAPHVRLFVGNAPGLRASQGTRVLVDRYFVPGIERPVTVGSPALGWTSADAPNEAAVMFSGAERVIDLGVLFQDDDGRWRRFELQFPQLKERGVKLADDRQIVGIGTRIRLVVGSDEADVRFYDVTVGWNIDAGDAEDAIWSFATRVDEVHSSAAA